MEINLRDCKRCRRPYLAAFLESLPLQLGHVLVLLLIISWTNMEGNMWENVVDVLVLKMHYFLPLFLSYETLLQLANAVFRIIENVILWLFWRNKYIFQIFLWRAFWGVFDNYLYLFSSKIQLTNVIENFQFKWWLIIITYAVIVSGNESRVYCNWVQDCGRHLDWTCSRNADCNWYNMRFSWLVLPTWMPPHCRSNPSALFF